MLTVITLAEQDCIQANWSFIQLFQATRIEHGLSMSKLAELIGLDHSYVSRIESGSRRPSQEILERMAERLELSEVQTQRLLISAGYISGTLQEMLASEPEFLRNVLNEAHQLSVADQDYRQRINEGHQHLNKMHGSFL